MVLGAHGVGDAGPGQEVALWADFALGVVDSVFRCPVWAGDLHFSGGALWRWL
jgi:hypothetical protein